MSSKKQAAEKAHQEERCKRQARSGDQGLRALCPLVWMLLKLGEPMFTIVGDHHRLPHFTLLATLWERYNDPLYRCNSEPSILWTPEAKRCFAHRFTMNHFI